MLLDRENGGIGVLRLLGQRLGLGCCWRRYFMGQRVRQLTPLRRLHVLEKALSMVLATLSYKSYRLCSELHA